MSEAALTVQLEQAFGIQSSGVGTSSGGGGAAGGASSATVNPEGGAGEGGATQTAGTADQAAGGQQNKENAQANEESDDPNANSGDAPARSAGAAGGTNVQTFTGALNGVSAPPVTKDANSNRRECLALTTLSSVRSPLWQAVSKPSDSQVHGPVYPSSCKSILGPRGYICQQGRRSPAIMRCPA